MRSRCAAATRPVVLDAPVRFRLTYFKQRATRLYSRSSFGESPRRRSARGCYRPGETPGAGRTGGGNGGEEREGVDAEASARRRGHGRTDERGIPRVRGIGMEVGNRRTGGRIPSVLTLVRLMGTALFSPLAPDGRSLGGEKSRAPASTLWLALLSSGFYDQRE